MTEVLTAPDESVSAPGVAKRLDPLRSARLTAIPGIVHGVTHRVPGLGRADGNVGLGAPRDPQDAWAMRQLWSKEIGFDPSTVVGLRQVHGADVREVRSHHAGMGATPESLPIGSADALFTRDFGVTLMTLHADCLPILIVDPEMRSVAVIHSGWRGTVEDVAGQTIQAMELSFGCDPSRLIAFFGPSIGPCCYQVGAEVADVWRNRHDGTCSEALIDGEAGWVLDLRKANTHLLLAAGLARDNIEVTSICTKCNADRWFSHRGQGPATGRFGAFIAIKQVSP